MTAIYTKAEIKNGTGFPSDQRFIAMSPEQIGAFEGIRDLLADGYMLSDNATHFSCSEADTIADFLRAFGHGDFAGSFLGYHAEDDDEGDRHIATTDSDGYVTGVEYRTFDKD